MKKLINTPESVVTEALEGVAAAHPPLARERHGRHRQGREGAGPELVATHRQIGVPMTADDDFVRDVAFSPDGKIRATDSNDGTARMWAVTTQGRPA